MTSPYRTDLTDEQWELLSPLIPPAKPGGRPRTVDMRAVVNAIFYLLVTGCAWELLPHDFPKPKTVYHYFRQWRIEGDWQRIHDKLRQWVRVSAGRMSSPSAAILDSQSVKTGTMVQQSVGYDGGKRVKGRKRHLVVDTLGLMITVAVTAASVPEREGAKLVFAKLEQMREQFGRLVLIWVDGGYEGVEFMRWVMDRYRWVFETIKRSDPVQGFVGCFSNQDSLPREPLNCLWVLETCLLIKFAPR